LHYLNEILYEILLEQSPELKKDLKSLSKLKVDSDEYKKLKRKLSMKYHPDRGGSNEDAALLNNEIEKIEKSKNNDNRSFFTRVKEGVQDTKTAWKSDWKDRKSTAEMGKNYIEVADKKTFKEAIASLKHYLVEYHGLTNKLASFSLLEIITSYEKLEYSMGQTLNMLLSRERPIRVLLKKMNIDEEDINNTFNKLHKAKGETINEEILNEFVPLALPAIIGIAQGLGVLALIPTTILAGKAFGGLLNKVIISQQEKKGLYPVYEGKKITGFAPKTEAVVSNSKNDIAGKASELISKSGEVKSAIAKRASEGFISIKETLSPLGEFLKKTPEFINGHIPQVAAVVGGGALIIALAKHLLKKRKLEKFPNIEKEAKKLNKKYKEPIDKEKKD
jgi:hypothetical protein